VPSQRTTVLTDRRGIIIRIAPTDQTWLLTGGAGYVGSHVLSALLQAGYRAVVLDDLSTGLPRRVPAGVPLVQASILDADRIADAIHTHRVTGVVHLAAKKSVPQSVERPLDYWRENVGGMERLLTAMSRAGVERIVYSSSAAVYGTPDVPAVTRRRRPGRRTRTGRPSSPVSGCWRRQPAVRRCGGYRCGTSTSPGPLRRSWPTPAPPT
jgi:nucleoside-diphosphate-sugar epimerase